MRKSSPTNEKNSKTEIYLSPLKGRRKKKVNPTEFDRY